MEQFEPIKPKLSFESLKKETVVLDNEGKPILMYNRSNNDFEEFELGKRNLENKTGVNKLGFFFSDRNDLEHYGAHVKEKYINIHNPFDIRDLGPITEYGSFRIKLTEAGLSDKELAAFDLQAQELNIIRNKKLGSIDGYTTPTGDGLKTARQATFNFLDVGEGEYLRKLLESKGYDGILFTDEGELTAVAFHKEQLIPKDL